MAAQSAQAVTIGDVAAAAGVSRATVSRVLNGLATVDREIVARVEQTIAELGYRPSVTARNLSLGRTNTVGVVVPDLGNPMFQAILSGVTRAAGRDGKRILVADTGEQAGAEREVALEMRRATDALVLCAPRMPDPELSEVLAQSSPVVIVNRAVADSTVSQIALDYADATAQVIDRLATLGHRRVLYLGGPIASASNRLRVRAIADAATRHPEVSIEQMTVGPSLGDGTDAVEAALASGASAVMAYNDLVAIGLISGLRERGVDVPGRISVVGMDDIPFARFAYPTLTSVALPQDQLGELAWQALRAALDPTLPPFEAGGTVWLRGQLQERDSTGPAPR